MNKLKQLIGEGRAIFASALCLLTCGLLAPSALAEMVENVKYIDADGTEKTCPSANVVSASANRETWNAGWYVVTGNVALDNGAECDGAVNLILADGSVLTINPGITYSGKAGIAVTNGNSLAIYGQTHGTGWLNVTGKMAAGIGGQMGGVDNGHITINGGTIRAKGGSNSAGIGGGPAGAGTHITINGGDVKADDSGSGDSSGIGGGSGGASSDIFAAENLVVKADANTNPPTNVIEHTGTTDLALNADFKGKSHVTVALPDYSILLDDGKAYKGFGGSDITADVAKKGLRYDEAGKTWVMSNFVFKTTGDAVVFVVGLDEEPAEDEGVSIKVEGVNVLECRNRGGATGLKAYRNLTLAGSGSLSVEGLNEYQSQGIECGGDLTIRGITFTAKADGSDMAQGILVSGDLVIDGADVTATASETDWSYGLEYKRAVIVKNGGTLFAKGHKYGIHSETNDGMPSEPNAVAKDGDGNELVFQNSEITEEEETVYFGYYLKNGSETDGAKEVYLTEIIPSVQIPSAPTPVANATAAVYTNGVLSADGMVWSNGTATVVYTAEPGYFFEGYVTAVTNALDTTVDPAMNAAGETVPVAKEDTFFITFSASEPFGIRMWKKGDPSVKFTLECSTDKAHWTAFDWEKGATAGADNKLFLRGTGNTAFADGVSVFYAFTNTATSAATAIACSGNVMTLLDYATVAKGEEPTMGSSAFARLFCGFAALTAAPDLPAKNLTWSCYNFMFQYCTSLTAAPELPAETLAGDCYQSMFSGCTSLTAAPELSAETLTDSCYHSMFLGCTSLTAAPELPAETLANFCYQSMFSGCTSLTAAPELPAETLANFCYQDMFSGCASLTDVPELNATNLTAFCYTKMFMGCTALTAAPKLPATKMMAACYQNMFDGCTALETLPDLPATNLANGCYASMFANCTQFALCTSGEGTPWSIPAEAVALDESWNHDMFSGVAGDIAVEPNKGPVIGKTYYVRLCDERVVIPADNVYEMVGGESYMAPATTTNGGAFYLEEGAKLVGKDVSFVGNCARSGGAIYSNKKGKVNLSGTVVFSGNTSKDGSGGALVTDGSVTIGGDVTFTNNAVTGERGEYGGAVELLKWSSMTVDGKSVFACNRAKFAGAANVDVGSALHFVGETLWIGNAATGQEGGAIYNKGNVTFDAKTVFSGNSANKGGAIFNCPYYSTPKVSFRDELTLDTDTDTIYNWKGELVWDLTEGGAPCLNGFQRVINRVTNDEGTLDDGTLKLTADDSIIVPTNIVIATGDLTALAGKDTFTLVVGDETKQLQVGAGGCVLVGGRDYRLSVSGNELVLEVKEAETEMVTVQVTPAGRYSTVEIWSDDAKVEGDQVRKNSLTYAVYKADEGCRFADGKTEHAYVVDTSTDPAVYEGDAPTALITATFAVNSAWQDKTKGDEVTLAGDTYAYGLNAFSEAQDALTNLESGTVNLLFAGNEKSYGNVNFSTAKDKKALTVFTDGEEVLFGRFNKTGANKYTPDITIGEGSAIKADDLGIWAWDTGSDIVTQTVTLDTNSKLTLTNMYEGSRESVSLLSNGRLVMNEGSVLKLAYGLEMEHFRSIWNGDVSVTANSAEIDAGGSLIANKRCYFTLNDSTATFPYVSNYGSITLNNSTFIAPAVPVEEEEGDWWNASFVNNYSTMTLNDSALTVDDLNNDGSMVLSRSTVDIAWEVGNFGETMVLNHSTATAWSFLNWAVFEASDGEVDVSSYDNHANQFGGYVSGLKKNTVYKYRLFDRNDSEVGEQGEFETSDDGDYNHCIFNTDVTSWKVYEADGTKITDGVESAVFEGGTTLLKSSKITVSDIFYNGGHSTFVMDADSTISFGGAWTNEGTIVVDLANATKGNYKIADNMGTDAMTLASYGGIELVNDPDGVYTNTVVGNDLFVCRMDQPNQLVANDFQAIADKDSYDGETFTVGGVKYTVGRNAFKSLHDANEAGMMMWVTNVHVYGLQHMDFAMSSPAPWTLELHDDAVLTIGVDLDGHLLSSVTNELKAVRGRGSIAFGKQGDDETEAVQRVLESLRESGSEITVIASTVAPTKKGEEGDQSVTVDAKAETTDDGVTVVEEILNPDGNVTVEVAEDAKGDTLVAGNVVAKDKGEVTVVNASENTLAVAGAVEATDGTVTVRNASTGVLSVAGGIKASSVTVDNYGHFESDVNADGISVTNRSSNTVVGTLSGTFVSLTGIGFAAIRDVTVEGGRFDLEGDSALTGPLTLKSNEVVNNGTLAWKVTADNFGKYLNNFNKITDGENASYAVIVDEAVRGETYVLAEVASNADKREFTLVRGGQEEPITVGGEAVSGFRLYLDDANRLCIDVPATQPVELTAESAEKEYDGLPLTADEFTVTAGAEELLRNGHRVVADVAGEILDVGSVANEVATYKVVASDGSDQTSLYKITTKPGTLTVTKVSEPLVLTAKPVRVSDGAANGFSFTEGVLVDGDEVFADVAVATNEDGTVVCSIADYAILRGRSNVTANYTVVLEDSTVANDPNAEYTVVTSTKEIPKVAKGEEVTFGEEGKPAVIDFQVKNATFSVGANAKYALVGTMRNAKTVKVAAGTKTRVDGVSVQNTTEAALGVIEGTSVLTSGSYTDVALDYLSGTEKADKVTVGSKSVFAAGDIDLGAGTDKLSVGTEATFSAGDLFDVDQLAFGSRSTNEIGTVAGVQKVTLAAGKSATSTASAVPTVLVAGDLEMLSDKANAISLGKNTESSFGDVLMGEKNDRISIGDNATAFFGCVAFGGGRDTLTVGKNSTVLMVAYEDDCASLTKFTVGKGTTAYLSSELIAMGKALEGSRIFGEEATIVDLGPADVARLFTLPEEERADNAEKTAQTLSRSVEGWLSDVKDASGVAYDGDDWFVADRDLVINVTVTEGHLSEVSLYVNGVRQTSPFGRDRKVDEGDVIRLHKGAGGSAAGYAIEAWLR